MLAVGLLQDPCFLEHETSPRHPEGPQRLVAIHELLDREGLGDQCAAINVEPALEESLSRVHTRAMLDALAAADRSAQERRVFLDQDTVVTARSLAAARLAVGGVLRAAVAVARGELDAALCLPRPPGHHATGTRAMGFCLYNNVAVAVAHLLTKGLAERVAIVDFDVHHGNGTQDIFYEEPRVLYVSLHQFPHYPGTGLLDETGGAAAPGANLNLPLPPACGDVEYLRCFDEVVVPALRRFAPSLVMVSAGFDAHWRDPLAQEDLSGVGYRAMAERLRDSAAELSAGQVYVLEGGYDLEALAWSVRHCLDVLLGNPAADDPVGAAPSGRGLDEGDVSRLIARVRELHGI